MSTIPHNPELLNNLFVLLEAHRALFHQNRTYQRVVAMVLAEIFAFGRSTVTQLLMTLGETEHDWSAWYWVLRKRFAAEGAAGVLLLETLKHVGEDEVYVVAGDGTQTPRTGKKIEGVGWLRNMRTPPFRVGIHQAQRWFNGSWLLPAERGYSRAMPLRWLPAFTEKSRRKEQEACKEWEAAVAFLRWLQQQFRAAQRAGQRILMVADGSYDTIELWKALPEGVILLARSAKNRVLHYLPPAGAHGNRKYGQRASTPQAYWQQRQGWRRIRLTLRGRQRTFQYRVEGPFLRKGAPGRPLFLLVVRGQSYTKHGRSKRREPVPYLVNARLTPDQSWTLPLPVRTLLFWAWQRWEVEVCHRELKSNFGLGDKQCWNPTSAVTSVQWSAWVYSLMLLAGYRTWGLCNAPPVPTRWWRGADRWSFTTLHRAFRAALWGSHDFRPLWASSTGDWHEKHELLQALGNAVYGSSQL
jgi:hypothetical protein